MFTFRGLLYVPLLAACLCAGLAVSCNGTGGAAHAGGELYTGGGTGSSGPDGSSTGSYSLLDVTSLANMRDVETLLAIFSAGAGEEEASNTIVLNADELGLPDGGFVTLTMNWSGGSYTRTVQKNADGTVTFNGIPFIADDTQVTVDLAVKNANHEEVWAGSGTNEVKNGSCNIHVELERYLPLSELAAYIAALPPGTAGAPNRLPPISGLTAGDVYAAIQTLGDILRGYDTTWVDLSSTTLPEGITSLYYAFDCCIALAKSPRIPASVIDMTNCFSSSGLTVAPDIPPGVTDMESCFQSCTQLTTAPVIPERVQDMNHCFAGCYNLLSAPEIPASVTDLSYCFSGCSTGFAGTNPAIIIKANITDPGKFAGFMQSSYTSGVYVISDAVKTAILSATSTGLSAGNIIVGLP